MRFIRVVLLVIGTGAASGAVEPPAGVVKVVHGEATLIRQNGNEPCQEGMRVAAGDTIRTRAGASVGVMLLDGTRLALGQNSEIVIKSYMFDPPAGKYGVVLDVLRGMVAYVSGRIGRLSPQSVEIRTPVGILGTRGTALAAKIESGTQ